MNKVKNIFVALAIFALVGCAGLIRSKHFTIQNMSGAMEEELQRFAATLEQARVDVVKFLGREPPRSIWVELKDGYKIPSSRGGRLHFYRFHNRISAGAAHHEIVHLTTGYSSLTFIEEGLAVYVAESLAPNAPNLFPRFAQSVDAWMTLFLQEDTYIPLSQIFYKNSFDWNLDGSTGDTEGWQTYIEAGSFVRWIVETKGWATFWKFHQTRRVSAAVGSSLSEAERRWIEHVRLKKIKPKSCRFIFPQGISRYQFWCNKVEPGGTTLSTVQLPPDVRIVPPPPGLSNDLAAFSGKWTGRWEGGLDHILVVEKINPPYAFVIYAYGIAPILGIDQAGWRRVQGKFMGSSLKLSFPSLHTTVIYRMHLDGTLEAIYESPRGITRANMTRINE